MIRAVTLDAGCTIVYESSCKGESPSNALTESLKALTQYLNKLGYSVSLADVMSAVRSWGDVRSKYYLDFIEFNARLRVHYILRFLGVTPKPPIVEEALKIMSKSSVSVRRIYDDVARFLEWVKGRGLHLAIISNASYHDEVLDVLRSFNVLRYFDLVITSNITIYKKPSKEIFEITSQLLGVEPKYIVHVGDSLADIEGALNAGYRLAIELARHRECITRVCAKNLDEVSVMIRSLLSNRA